MSLDFTHQQKIIEYIKSNYSANLPTGYITPEFIDDYLDFDKYKKPIQLFFSFPDYDFENLTNESKKTEIEFSIYISFQNDTSKKLKEKMKVYAKAFFDMAESTDYSYGGACDWSEPKNLHFYNAAEGSANIKIVEITSKIILEI